ncbi:hypothetical protein [Alloactinosynnema sp. L-07]|nr:hypothetical protein [Alloactinosynnema sp. L-07]
MWSDPSDAVAGAGETWSDGDTAAADRELIDTHTLFKLQTERAELAAARKAQGETRRHNMRMQVRVLSGVGLVFAFTLVLLAIGLWRDLFPLEFATELMRMVIPTVLGAGLTIVGVFFRSNSGGGEA